MEKMLVFLEYLSTVVIVDLTKIEAASPALAA